MSTPVATTLLQRQIDAMPNIGDCQADWHLHEKWLRDTEVVVDRIFGAKGRHLQDLKRIHFVPMVMSPRTTPQMRLDAYRKGTSQAHAILTSMIEEVRDFGVGANNEPVPDAEARLARIFNSFHAVVRELRRRHDSRPTLDVADEYDVQDLLRALLRIEFEDVREEEHTPSHAGSASRVDFLLKAQQVVVEIKKTRPGLNDRKLGDELIVDIDRYRAHPDCKSLFCFVYDPDERLSNPAGIERDLSRDHPLRVRVLVRPVRT